jgi:site-specific recombinase XerD
VEFELEDTVRVIVRDMLTITRATDLFLDDLLSRGYSQRTVDTYRRLLDKFADSVPADYDVGQVTDEDCRRYFLRFSRSAPGTRAHAFSVLSSFFKWLYGTEKIKRNPLDRMTRPKRIPSEDLDVLTLSSAGVRCLLEHATSWPERITLNVLAYLGPRRHAVAMLRLRDYDEPRGRIRFREKGGKTIWKRAPRKLSSVLNAAIAAGVYTQGPDSYLIPPEGPLSRSGDRDDRVIWRIVKKVADRAGVDAHVHALRAAFAVFYLEQPGADPLALKDLMGHRSFATTQVYLRKRDKEAAMDSVVALDWGDNTEAAEISQFARNRFESSASSGGGRI